VLFEGKPPPGDRDLMERALTSEARHDHERRAGAGVFSIGESACHRSKPHVLRYWESQFRFLNPAKNRSGNRVYQRREIELIMLVKHLLYTEKYTIEGARQRIEHFRRTGELKPSAHEALNTEMLRDLKVELQQLMRLLNGSSRCTA